MKEIFGIYKKYMFRPILYKTVTKLVIAIVLVLLWDRYINTFGLPAAEYGCFCIGGIIFLMAWFEYLRLDGMVLSHLNDKKQKKKKRYKCQLVSPYWHTCAIEVARL